MQINLPYEINTTFNEKGTEYLDLLDHYVIDKQIKVVLLLSGNRLSTPILLNDFLDRWEKFE